MTNRIATDLKRERDTADSWRARIDELTGEAERRALAGKLTVKEKLGKLKAHQQEASARLSSAGDTAADGWDETKKHLASLWKELEQTSKSLADELRGEREGADPKGARGDSRAHANRPKATSAAF